MPFKKILFFATIPASIKEFSLDYMKFLRDQGYVVEAAAGIAHQTEYVRSQGFVCYDFPIPRGIDPLGDWRAYRAIRKIIRNGKYDIIHTQTAKAGFLGRLAAWRENIPLVIHTAHAWPFHPLLTKLLKYYYLFLEKLAAKICDAIIVDSHEVRRYGLENHVTTAKKVYQIYMGIDCNRFRPCTIEEKLVIKKRLNVPEEKFVIGAISRLVEDKGIETLIEIAGQLKKRGRNFIILLLGEGNKRSLYENLVQSAGLQDNFRFIGYIDDVVPYHQIFDVFCLPTLREGFGVVFAEASACAVPVVSTNIAPLDEVVINGQTGFLAPPKDVRAFCDALQGLFDPAVARIMGEAGRLHVEQNFSIHSINQQTLTLYNKLWQTKFNK